MCIRDRIVNGYAREVLAKLPMEFAVEAQKLLAISLEGSVGSVSYTHLVVLLDLLQNRIPRQPGVRDDRRAWAPSAQQLSLIHI